ncbi:MAG: hypothetical protein RIG68_12445 [Imperialibacter sp.]|uniref:hypothetical protein n=1 Tax=Imperialibacter sp. TaxID=2038411 RepID=UPI0032EF7AF0
MTKTNSENGKPLEDEKVEKASTKTGTKPKKCGLIMPISPTSGYDNNHWEDVKRILLEVTDSLELEAALVSDDKPSGLIHERIVHNLYLNDIVICDVSSANPNVMFELGMRLAFDMPTIIIKDDLSKYNFDIAPVQHLKYPTSLHYHEIENFKKDLAASITATLLAAKVKDYSPFLKAFSRTIPKKLEQIEVEEGRYILEKLESLASSIDSLKRTVNPHSTAIASYLEDVANDYSHQMPDAIRKKFTPSGFPDLEAQIVKAMMLNRSTIYIKSLIKSYAKQIGLEFSPELIEGMIESARNSVSARQVEQLKNNLA